MSLGALFALPGCMCIRVHTCMCVHVHVQVPVTLAYSITLCFQSRVKVANLLSLSFKKLFLSLPKDVLIARGREGKSEGEKHHCEREAMIGCMRPSWGPTCNLGMCSDWESNPQSSGMWDVASTN